MTIDLLAWISGGQLVAFLGYVIRLENRLTRLETILEVRRAG